MASLASVNAAVCFCNPTRTETEPNDTPATANDLGEVSFSTVIGKLPREDVDYFRFTAPTNSRAWITVDTGGMASASGSTRDSIVTLLASNGKTILETDDNDGSGNGGDNTLESGMASAIAGRLLPGGVCYVQVKPAGSGGVVNPYRLLLTVTSGAIPSEREPNDTALTATPIVPFGARVGVCDGYLKTNDMDCYAFTVPGRSLVHISADSDPERDGASHNLIVDLIGRDASILGFTANSSQGGQPDPAAEGFGFMVSQDATNTCYVRVREASGLAGSYRLMVAICPVPTVPRIEFNRRDFKVCDIGWPAASGFWFRPQYSQDLKKWFDLPCEMNLADDRIQVTVSTLGDFKRFYRLTGYGWPIP